MRIIYIIHLICNIVCFTKLGDVFEIPIAVVCKIKKVLYMYNMFRFSQHWICPISQICYYVWTTIWFAIIITIFGKHYMEISTAIVFPSPLINVSKIHYPYYDLYCNKYLCNLHHHGSRSHWPKSREIGNFNPTSNEINQLDPDGMESGHTKNWSHWPYYLRTFMVTKSQGSRSHWPS